MKKAVLFTILTALTFATAAPAYAAVDTVHATPPQAGAVDPSSLMHAGDVPDTFAAASSTTLEGKLNVNDASSEQWTLLPGVGPSTADKLVAYQKKHGFKEVIHVMRVKGIGRKTYDKIKPYLTLKGETTLHVVK